MDKEDEENKDKQRGEEARAAGNQKDAQKPVGKGRQHAKKKTEDEQPVERGKPRSKPAQEVDKVQEQNPEEEGILEEAVEMRPPKPKRKKKDSKEQGFAAGDTNTEPRYLAVRQVRAEFGGVSRIASAFKNTMHSHLQYFADDKMYSRIQSKFMDILKYDADAPKGSATLAAALQKEAARRDLNGYSFSKKRSLGYALPCGYEFDPKAGTFTIRDFSGNDSVRRAQRNRAVGLQLILLRLDLSKGIYSRGLSPVRYFWETDLNKREDLVLKAPIPPGEGPLMGLIYVGQTLDHGEFLSWAAYGTMNVLAVVGIE